MTDSTDRNVPRVTLNLFRGCLVATLQVDLTPAVLDRFQKDLLGQLATNRATRAIFDCSGLEIMDPEEFEGLRRVAAMARLLGVRVVLAGLRPGVVGALIAMDVETGGLLTALTLDDAFSVHDQAEREMTDAEEYEGNAK
jgi:rsbT antagonist protein RsbS